MRGLLSTGYRIQVSPSLSVPCRDSSSDIQTDKKWLLVYDNAEQQPFLKKFWPEANHGSILLTTRNRSLSIWPATAGLEITVFSKSEGADFLLHLLVPQELSREVPSTEDLASATETSTKVGGHALALTQIVALICTR